MTAQTTQTKTAVVIIGPNLRKQDKGTFHVHAAGCADIERDPKRYGYKAAADGQGGHMQMDAGSVEDIAEYVYADMIFANDQDPVSDYVSEFHIAPCVKFTNAAPEQTAAENAFTLLDVAQKIAKATRLAHVSAVITGTSGREARITLDGDPKPLTLAAVRLLKDDRISVVVCHGNGRYLRETVSSTTEAAKLVKTSERRTK